MKDLNCEDFLIQKMALIDGEAAGFSEAQINEHLANCENCRHETGRLQNMNLLFERQTRRAQTADLWSAIEKQIGAKSEASLKIKWQPFAFVGVLLVVYKFVEMVPERDFGWILKIVPLVLIVALFGFLKENPFKINTELILEK